MLKRSAFKVQRPPREQRDRTDEFASYRARPANAIMAARLELETPVAVPPRIEGRVSNQIRDSARGEECTVRIVGACTHNPEKTIWSHAPFGAAGKGRGIKAIDVAGAYCCTACDAVVDGQRPLPPGASRDSTQLDWFQGHLRSLVILKQKGLV